MKTLFFLLGILFFLVSCGGKQQQEKVLNESKKDIEVAVVPPDPEVAIRFLNAYIKDGFTEGWLEKSGYVTEKFISERNVLIKEATEADPEMGLDHDPITQAQDIPSKYELKSFDEKTGLVTAIAKDWEDYSVKLRIIQEGDKWLVDGAGDINMPH